MTAHLAPAGGDERPTHDLPAPPAVRWIVRTLEEAGFETWAVGGAIRDELLGALSTDWDFATRARPGDVRRLFPRTVPVGVEHGTVGVLARDGIMYEVTTFRRDVETDGRRAVVSFSDHIEDDLARRDFTINAVAWHPLRRELYDPFGGAGDLQRRLLRTVGRPHDRFAEDYLRVLRGLRFAGRFELEIDPDTWTALCGATARLGHLSPERVREELLKVLAQDPRPARSLGYYRRAGVLAAWYPELTDLSEALWKRTAQETQTVRPHRPWLRVAALLAHAGVPETPTVPDAPAIDGLAAADATAARGAARAAALLTRLRASKAQVAGVARRVAAGPLPPPQDASAAELRRWLSRTGVDLLPDLARLWIARARAGTGPDPLPTLRRLRTLVRDGTPLAVADLALDGRDLVRMGFRPGPRFGEMLQDLLAFVLERPERNTPSDLEARVRERWGGES